MEKVEKKSCNVCGAEVIDRDVCENCINKTIKENK